MTIANRPFRALAPSLLLCLLAAAVSAAQAAPPPDATGSSPLVTHGTRLFQGTQKILLRTAEMMPEESYGFTPADTVRTFGQILGHVADTQYFFCSAVLGEPSPAPAIEETRTAKADLIAALGEAFAYCDRAYQGLTDASAAETVKLMGRDRPKLSALTINNMHTIQHYGNLLTYLRINSIVPPTSDQEFMRSLRN
jgi:uncharacterized damage-inducible protein DinB